MSEEETKKSWWQTLPGILTGITATITALAGLLVAVNQTGWFAGSKSKTQSVSTPGAVVTPAEASRSSSAENEAPAPSAAPVVETNAAPTSAPSPSSGSVQLPSMRDYKLSTVVFTVLEASLESRNTETALLKLQIRLLNNGNYPINFWDSQFRLVIEGSPRAPTGGLNKTVAGNSADEGEVTFVVSKSVAAAQLRILFGEEKTDVSLKFSQS